MSLHFKKVLEIISKIPEEQKEKRDQAALSFSILKWRSIIDSDTVDYNNCALCRIHKSCETCPVSLKVEAFGCLNTPYEKWMSNAEVYGNFVDNSNTHIMFPLAENELMFLADLYEELYGEECPEDLFNYWEKYLGIIHD